MSPEYTFRLDSFTYYFLTPFVVITITPLIALTPHLDTKAESLKTVIDSISSGFMDNICALFITIPFTTYKGSLYSDKLEVHFNLIMVFSDGRVRVKPLDGRYLGLSKNSPFDLVI